MKKLWSFACAAVAAALVIEVASELFNSSEDLFVLQGMFVTLVRMWFYSSDAGVQTEACELIGRRSFVGLTRVQRALRRAGAELLVAEALRRFPTQLQVQQQCLFAMQGLSVYDASGGEAVTKAGGVELAIAAMRRYPEEPSIAARGSFIGAFCDFSAECKRRFRECGGIEVLLEAVRRHEVLGWSPDDMFHLWCGFAAGLPDPQNVARFVQADGIELGVKVMKAHSASPRVREEVLAAFFQPAAQSVEGRRRIVASALEEILRAMREEPHDDHVQNNAAFVVRHLASNSVEYKQLLEAAGAVKLLIAALHEYTQQQHVSRHSHILGEKLVKDKFWPLYPTVCEALVPFASTATGIEAMSEAGIMKEISDVLSLGGQRDRDAACDLLGRLGSTGAPLQSRCSRPPR